MRKTDNIPAMLGAAYYVMMMLFLHYGQLGDDNVMNYLVRFYVG